MPSEKGSAMRLPGGGLAVPMAGATKMRWECFMVFKACSFVVGTLPRAAIRPRRNRRPKDGKRQVVPGNRIGRRFLRAETGSSPRKSCSWPYPPMRLPWFGISPVPTTQFLTSTAKAKAPLTRPPVMTSAPALRRPSSRRVHPLATLIFMLAGLRLKPKSIRIR
jgi:hypothetical protein